MDIDYLIKIAASLLKRFMIVLVSNITAKSLQ
jgi:hypothetical protein